MGPMGPMGTGCWPWNALRCLGEAYHVSIHSMPMEKGHLDLPLLGEKQMKEQLWWTILGILPPPPFLFLSQPITRTPPSLAESRFYSHEADGRCLAPSEGQFDVGQGIWNPQTWWIWRSRKDFLHTNRRGVLLGPFSVSRSPSEQYWTPQWIEDTVPWKPWDETPLRTTWWVCGELESDSICLLFESQDQKSR